MFGFMDGSPSAIAAFGGPAAPKGRPSPRRPGAACFPGRTGRLGGKARGVPASPFREPGETPGLSERRP
jgi:hypothetical protein